MRVPCSSNLIVLAALIVQPALALGPLNDTGAAQTQCIPSLEPCAQSSVNGGSYPRQDWRFGRDAEAATGGLVKIGGGSAGFDFTKVCHSGQLAGQGSCPTNPVMGSGANQWACTKDNVTGLFWEVKTDDGGLRDSSWTYTWYSSDYATNGLWAGSAGSNTCGSTLVAPPYNNQCNTENYVVAVRASVLCGNSDWRLPAATELEGIGNFGRQSPAIDLDYFPNTKPMAYWTGSATARTTFSGVVSSNAYQVEFMTGLVQQAPKASANYVRLVRGAP